MHLRFRMQTQTQMNNNQTNFLRKMLHTNNPSSSDWPKKKHSTTSFWPKKSGKKSFFFSLVDYITMWCAHVDLRSGTVRSDVFSKTKVFFFSHVNGMWVSNGRANWVVCRCCCFIRRNLTPKPIIVRRNSIALAICFDLIRTSWKKCAVESTHHKFTRTNVTQLRSMDERTNSGH